MDLLNKIMDNLVHQLITRFNERRQMRHQKMVILDL